jgi:group I intron endonuclease
MGYVYLITNTINNKKYIGQTKCDDIETRWNSHRKMLKDSIGRYLLSAYKKYGIEKFKFQIICICFDECCDTLEEYYIKKFNTLVPNGYNLKAGGKSTRHHEETKKLIGKRLKERVTDEIRQEMRERSKNSTHFSYLKVYTQEEKEQISKKQKEYWANLTEEQREKISEERKNRVVTSEKVKIALEKGRKLLNKKVGKKVAKYDMNGILLNIYKSISEASNDINISHSTISCVCRGKPGYKTAGGFIWKYLDQ